MRRRCFQTYSRERKWVITIGAINPLPWPGNGDHPETPLSRLTPNVGENHPYVMSGTPPQHAHAQLCLVENHPKKGDFELHTAAAAISW